MIVSNLFKLFISVNVFLTFGNIEQPATKVEVSDSIETTISVETKTYKEDFLKYPQVQSNNLEVQETINDLFKKHIESSYKGYVKLKEEMEKFKEEDKEHCKEFPYSCEYSYDTRYEVKYNQDGKLSIVMYDATYSGGAHGSDVFQTYNFNSKTGDLYTLKDILSSESKFESITAYVKNYIKEHQDIFSDLEIIGDFSVNEQTQFYFTEDGIDLIFQQYEVAPYASGHPIISIPKSEL